MTRRGGWAGLLVLAFSGHLTSTALAQTTPETAPTPAASGASPTNRSDTEAKERFFRGIQLAERNEWEAALAEFLRSLELVPTRVAAKNAAISLRRLGRYREALELYQRLLKEFQGELSQEERAAAQDAVAQLDLLVGSLLVTSDPAGANVIVDGVERGTTPLSRPILVNAGEHSIRVWKQGFQTYETRIVVAGQQRKALRAPLTPLHRSGRLRVSEASGLVLSVVVDGAVVGSTPWDGVLEAGPRMILLRGSGNVGSPPVSAAIRQD